MSCSKLALECESQPLWLKVLSAFIFLDFGFAFIDIWIRGDIVVLNILLI